jgi:hemolysin activation/secretion protein
LQKNKTAKNTKLSQRLGAAALVSAEALISVMSAAAYAAVNIDNIPPSLRPDAGQIQQEIDRGIEARPTPKLPEVEEAAPKEEDEGPRVVIKQFKFEGNKVLTEAELQSALDVITGREITIKQLRSAADLIAAFYREKGFLATATLPEQDITDGVVVIKIVEANFGSVKFDGEYGKDFKRIRPSVINRVVESSTFKGQVLNQADLDRALTVMQKMSGFDVSANYQAGEAEGSTDVLMKVKDKPLLSGSFSADNSGGRSTGRVKGTAGLGLASPLGYGDALNLTALHSEGTDYASMAYTVPVGGRGLQVGFNSSYLEYTVITKGDIQVVRPKGTSVVYGVDASYPLIIAKSGNLNLEANFDRKLFVNELREAADSPYKTSSDYNVDVFSVALSGNYYDGFLAGGINNASVNFASGYVNLDSSYNQIKNESNKVADAASVNTQGSYNRIKWNLSRNQYLTDTLVLSLDASGQIADKNLDSSEKFYLGGMNGVRAYPTSEGAGSEGYLFKVELRKYLPYNFNASIFMDDGKVEQYYHTLKSDGTSLLGDNVPNEYHLRGYGATLAWNGPYNSNFKAIYARRMGNNPNPLVNSTTNVVTDQDGAMVRDVFWLSGGIAF